MTDPRFVGVLCLSPSSEGKMQVDNDFGFIDSRGVRWDAHKGDVVDGASIPTLFKPIIGGAFNSPYLPAAVLHDIYCQLKTRSWLETDIMFLQAMRTNGVSFWKSYAMYAAVVTFGPRW